MRVAVFSDIHGNFHAMQAAWGAIEQERPDSAYCPNDLVGIGAFPQHVISFVRETDLPDIIGDYLDGVGFDRDQCGCVSKDPVCKQAGQALPMGTRGGTTADNRAFPLQLGGHIRTDLDGGRLQWVHGSPRKMNEYRHEHRPRSCFERMAAQAEADVHPFRRTRLPDQKWVAGRLLVNTGPVGKPKRGDPRAGLLNLQPEHGEARAEFHRGTYNLAAAAAFRESDPHGEFADQIEAGLQPACAGETHG